MSLRTRLRDQRPDQVIGPDHDPYMLRWFVIPKNPYLRIYIHKFMRSDEDRALHDHPWPFLSLILRGWYVEHSERDGKPTALLRSGFGIDTTGFRSFQVQFPQRLFVFRPATYRHRVALIPKWEVEEPCWTLIVTGPKFREWGFWCVDKIRNTERFVHWTQWGGAGCGEYGA